MSKTKHLAGWISRENMNEPRYLEQWQRAAEKAEAAGYLLVAFRIPANKFGMIESSCIESIELILQEYEKKS